jgi:hypothetical protein
MQARSDLELRTADARRLERALEQRDKATVALRKQLERAVADAKVRSACLHQVLLHPPVM